VHASVSALLAIVRISFFTSTRRHCDPSCLLVRSFVCSCVREHDVSGPNIS